jgi:hypothetical protein
VTDAVPVQTHDGRVVLQVTVVDVDGRRDEAAGGLTGMQGAGTDDQVRQIDARARSAQSDGRRPRHPDVARL